MTLDMTIGLLIGLAAVCVGGLITLLVLYWRNEGRIDRNGPPGGFDESPEGPSSLPGLRIPDFVPAEWIEQAEADRPRRSAA